MGLSIFDERYPTDAAGALASGQGTGINTLVAVQLTPVRIDHVYACNSDTIDHVMQVHMGPNGGTTQIGSANVIARAGFDGLPSVDVLLGALPAGADGVVLPVGWVLSLANKVVMTGATVMSLHAIGGLL